MDKIYLEISIEETIEKEFLEKELINQIRNAYEEQYFQKSTLNQSNDVWKMRVEFSSQKEFEEIYEKSYQMYVYLFDNFISKHPGFEALFQNTEDAKRNSKLSKNIYFKKKITRNYMVLRYSTNCIWPLRRYFGFTARVNKIFGSHVANEEIENGYIRFIETKEDFLSLLQPADIEEDWKGMFKIRHVDMNHPLIKGFFETLQEWNENYDKQT